MEDNKPEITEDFVESMVDRIITELGKKFEDLDISLDYIAAALLDDSAIGISSRQSQKGRFAKLPRKRRPLDDGE
tara:strand:- start:6771 stop:6995 length:225 start_codon:yes stop_codon:yes gene_type:complete